MILWLSRPRNGTSEPGRVVARFLKCQHEAILHRIMCPDRLSHVAFVADPHIDVGVNRPGPALLLV